MDITLAFEARVAGSSPAGGTKLLKVWASSSAVGLQRNPRKFC